MMSTPIRFRLTHGNRQSFRNVGHDITVRGNLDGFSDPLRRSVARLNDSERGFYVEVLPDDGIDWLNGYKWTPAELRCRHRGEFVVEIPASDPALRAGANELTLMVEDAGNKAAEVTITLDWSPEAAGLPFDLRDLGRFGDIQEVGMAVNGAFDLDRQQNVIRSRAPVAPDALLIVGPPGMSQEATFAVRFLELPGAKWMGLSDFFAGMTEGAPPRGLKVGWCSAGMAALTPAGEARSFIAWADHSGGPDEWAIATHPPARVALERDILYRVRHQRIVQGSVNRVRFRIWPDGSPEPDTWLCQEQDSNVPAHLPRASLASFALFQHMGMPIEWSDVLVSALDPNITEPADPSIGRTPFLRRQRPGAF